MTPPTMPTMPTMPSRSAAGRLTGLASALLALVAVPACAGCGRPDVVLCAGCRAELGGPARVVPVPVWPDAPPTAAAARYEGAVATCVNAWKERGRHDVEPVLGAALAQAVALVAGPRPQLVLVGVPSSCAARRRRGADGVRRLALHAAVTLRSATAAGAVRVLPALRLARRVADQAGLSAAARSANVAGAFEVRPHAPPLLAGRPVVVVDDVLTTGATLREAARAVTVAGGVVVGLASVSVTPLRRGLSALSGLD